ncbi:hypothetical protein U1Q18_020448 [Sarracenia purpurea var. burkii]
MGYQWDEANRVLILKARLTLHPHEHPIADDPLDDQDLDLPSSSAHPPTAPPPATQALVALPLSDSFEERLFARLDHMEAYMVENFSKLHIGQESLDE